MKIISIIFSFMLSFNLIAADANASRLSSLVDDFHYSVSVEWDQKDQEAFRKISDNFQSELRKVIEQENLSKADLFSFFDKKVKDKRLLSELQTRVQLTSPHPTPSEIFSIIEDVKSSMYFQGSSWGPEVGGIVIGSLLLIGLIIIMAGGASNGGSECRNPTFEQGNCGIKLVCVSSSYSGDYCTAYQEIYQCDEIRTCH